jgi:hypothetical protein
MRSILGSLDQLQPLLTVSIGSPTFPTDRETYTALIDTGATRTCITRRVVERLRLEARRKMLVASATSTPERRWAYSYSLGLFCSDAQPAATTLYVIPHEFVAPWFQDNGSFDVLLGMDVLSQGDLSFRRDGWFSFAFDF